MEHRKWIAYTHKELNIPPSELEWMPNLTIIRNTELEIVAFEEVWAEQEPATLDKPFIDSIPNP